MAKSKIQIPKILIRNRDGGASVEFALLSILLIFPLLTSLDFALFNLNRIKLNRAVGEAIIVSFNNRNTIDEAKISQILNASWNKGNLTVNTQCNGGDQNCTNTNRSCYCSSGTNAPTYSIAACNSLCPSGGTSGYFLTVTADTPYTPFFGSSFSPPSDISISTTIQLQ